MELGFKWAALSQAQVFNKSALTAAVVRSYYTPLMWYLCTFLHQPFQFIPDNTIPAVTGEKTKKRDDNAASK